MLADNRYQYGIDFNRPQQEQLQQQQQQHQRQPNHQRHQYAAVEDPEEEDEDLARKASQPQIITKDLTLSSSKYQRHSQRNDNDEGDEDVDDDIDEDLDVGNIDDMIAQTDVIINADDDETHGLGTTTADGQSTLHLPHARWPNHWSDINSQLSEATTPSVTYKWLTSPWSECSQKCGAEGSGLRVSL